MKQIDECLNRFFQEKKPLKKKWSAHKKEDKLWLFHYHHLVLVFDLKKENIIFEWWEKPADKRGLDAAKNFLKENKHRQISNI